MAGSNSILHSNFFIKLRNWEYWPFGILQFPLFIYFGWLSLKARSFIFFSASNPGIPMGGMFGESKYDILEKIPSQYIPKSVRVALPATTSSITKIIADQGLAYPLIFKPDLGERGFMVKRIFNEADVESYLSQIKINFIIQQLVDLPLEFGVFYTRFPNEKNGKVTSVVMKEMLAVTGDGKSTLQQLILAKDRAKLQWPSLQKTYHNKLNDKLKEGEVFELVSIGNHCLGTKFLNANHLINPQLSTTFDHISKQINGFYFGRFDLRCASIEDLYKGNVKIMELNGCGAEPAHIYHPGYSFFKALKDLFIHWRNIFLIAHQNHKQGVSYTTAKEALQYYKTFKAAVRQ